VKKEKKINYWGTDNMDEEEEKEEKEEKEIERDYDLGPDEWIKSERDYDYSELIERIYSFHSKKNPKLTSGDGKVVVKPPEVVREGTKKSNFLNFKDICENMNRTQDHLMTFLLSEMGTTGAIDSKGSLIVKGKFSIKDVESLLKKYYSK
jgi:translation initiation factor 2 subunit 2